MKLKNSLFLLMILIASTLFGYDWLLPDHPEGKHCRRKVRTEYLDDIYGYDVNHYNLYWDVTDTAERIVSGNVTISATATGTLNSFIFDLYDNMLLDSLQFTAPDGLLHILSSTAYYRSSHRVFVTLPIAVSAGQQLKMRIVYHGQPAGGTLMGLTFSTHGDNKAVVASLSEPQDSRIWWPCKDIPSDKAVADIYIVTHPHQLAASNGLLQNITALPNGKLVHHWKTLYPTPPYLLSLAVSNYKKHTIYYTGLNGSQNLPIELFAYPELESQTLEDCSPLPEMLKCFGERFGEYPFMTEKYGIALFGWGGAMEHQTCTTYGSHLINGQHTYDWVMAHELAHQWFGDLVTCATWKDLWLQEGGASYLENIWLEYQLGDSAYFAQLNKHKTRYLFEDGESRFPIYDPPVAYHFGKTTYNKGAWIYHMLRWVLGDSTFFSSMRSYLHDPLHIYANATTAQFITSLQNSSGVDLTAFKNEWIFAAGYPEYAWSYEISGHSLLIQLLQEQRTIDNTPLFTTPVPVKISFIGGLDTVITLRPTSRYQEFRYELPHELLNVKPLFNWQEKVLCTYRDMPPDSALHQLEGNPLEILKVYPNPSSGEFRLLFNIADYRMHEKLEYEICNTLGQQVISGQLADFQRGYNDIKISHPELPNGLYFIKLHYRLAVDYQALVKVAVVK